MEKKEFDEHFDKAYLEQLPDFNKHINIAIVGKVSTGKSSLLNAILGRDRSDPIAPVGANSGVTTKVTSYKLGKEVLIIDCPGLDDVHAENSEETKDFLKSIDLGLFVVTGSADVSQKENYEKLKLHTQEIIVILNKIDEWDDLEESSYDSVVDQWKSILNISELYGVCTKGYDPKMRKNAQMDVRGVEEVKNEIFRYLGEEGKELLLARHLKSREKFAIGIIASAVTLAIGQAFIPGSAAYITATQVAAITSLNYLYTGEVLSKSAALAVLPSFAAESIGSTAFLWAKSFIPPTGVLDVIAASIAATITFAMLAAVKYVFEKGGNLGQSESLKDAFATFKSISKDLNLEKINLKDLKNKDFLFEFVKKLLTKA